MHFLLLKTNQGESFELTNFCLCFWLYLQDHHQRKDALLKDGLYAAAAAAAAAAANMGVAPY
jgi:hypothetical protein